LFVVFVFSALHSFLPRREYWLQQAEK
jgi:hypothetical protein